MKAKPKWWPQNPYPESIFPNQVEDYAKIVPDPKMRTALSGVLGREFWNIASNSIWDALQNHLEETAEENLTVEDIELLMKYLKFYRQISNLSKNTRGETEALITKLKEML